MKATAPISAPTAPAPSLEPLLALVKPDLEQVNTCILEMAQSHVELVPLISQHLLNAGGKRLRPILTLAAGRLCGHEGTRHIPLAAAVELIHTATLLHDDVIDESQLRRGDPTANALWGNKASVLVGDFLLSKAFQMMVRDGDLTVMDLLSATTTALSEGEVWQLDTIQNSETSVEQYMGVITCKTARLFAAACAIGGVLSHSITQKNALYDYGHHLGIAFQIIDDALDYAAKEAELGKKVGDDFREGKWTLPVIYAYQTADSTERAFWERTMLECEQEEGDLTEAMRLIHTSGALSKALKLAEEHGGLARAALAGFPASPLRAALLETVDFCLHRAY